MTSVADINWSKAQLGELVERHRKGRDLSEFECYRDNPIGFASEVLGVTLWLAQEEIALAVRDTALVTVRSGNSVGKDFVSACLALWWVYAVGGLALITGPTQRQVIEIVMGEVRRLFTTTDLPGELYQQALRVDPGRGILAFTSNEVSKVTGFHGPRILAILTEGQGCDAFAYEGMLRCATGDDDRVLSVGNPVSPVGQYYEIHKPNSGWHTIKISVLEHPNLVHDRVIIPGGPTRTFVDRIEQQYGKDSPIYEYSVLGDFPETTEESLVRRSWLDAAATSLRAADLLDQAKKYRRVYAIDIGRLGTDESAVAFWQGPLLRRIVTWCGVDTMQSCGRIAALLRDEKVLPPHRTGREGYYGPIETRQAADVVIDEIGIGAGVVDRLTELGYRIHAFNAARRAHNSLRFLNRRAEAFWLLRESLEAGEVALPNDELLFQELLATQWSVTSAGKIQIVAKEQLRNEIGRSPDRADAAVMGYARYSEGAAIAATTPTRW